MSNDPIAQFQLNKLVPLEVGGYDLSFTNSSLFMVATLAVGAGFMIFASGGRGIVPTRMQSVAEMLYEFIAGTLRNATGQDGMRFFPLVFSLFMFILVANMLGMFPYFFTITSHLIVPVALAGLVMAVVIGVGFYKNGLGFLKLFVPSGVPGALIPLVTLIEVLSFCSRPISLSVRLFANMLAGHITLKVFAYLIVMMGSAGALGVFGAIFPLLMVVALTALEFLVAFLQAYVFAILTCMYLSDALHPGH